jgi:hypothetical protein
MRWFSHPAVGVVLIVLGAFLAIGVFANAEERGWRSSDTPMWWLLVFLPITVGILMISSRFLRNLGRRRNELEDAVFNVVYRQNGVINAASLAQGTDLSLDAAEDTLRLLARRGHLTPDLSESGVMIYRMDPAIAALAPPQGRFGPHAAKGEDSHFGMGIRQLEDVRRAVTLATGALVGGLVAGSMYLTLFAPQIWPQP